MKKNLFEYDKKNVQDKAKKKSSNNCGFISSVHFPLSMNVIWTATREMWREEVVKEKEEEEEVKAINYEFAFVA